MGRTLGGFTILATYIITTRWRQTHHYFLLFATKLYLRSSNVWIDIIYQLHVTWVVFVNETNADCIAPLEMFRGFWQWCSSYQRTRFHRNTTDRNQFAPLLRFKAWSWCPGGVWKEFTKQFGLQQHNLLTNQSRNQGYKQRYQECLLICATIKYSGGKCE